MGEDAKYDSSVGGRGERPFACHAGAAGDVATEDFVFMCEEMCVETGVDLEKLIECARFAKLDLAGERMADKLSSEARADHRNVRAEAFIGVKAHPLFEAVDHRGRHQHRIGRPSSFGI